jgi:hypothetical protein
MKPQARPTDIGSTHSRLIEHAEFLVLAACVLALVALHAWHGHWIGDFWEHSAVVRELATHPTRPRHPLLVVDAPHAFATPYALLVAMFCRLTGVSSVDGLAAAAVTNFSMLIVALLIFVGRMAPERSGRVCFFTLLFMLFLWGPQPWDFSGFYHINALIHTLGYPSVFAFWVALLLLAVDATRVEQGGWGRLLVTVPLGSIVLLSHPITFLFVATGVMALAADSRRPYREAGVSAASLLLSGLLALAWPYFPLWSLLAGGAAAYDANNAVMYSRALLRLFPALLGVPLLIAEARRTSRRSALAWVGLLLGIYAFGYLSGKYSYGRVISFIIFLLQLQIAKSVVRLEADVRSDASRRRARLLGPAMVVVCLLLSGRALIGALRDTLRGERTYAGLRFLERSVAQYDVMMTDSRTGWIASSFGGKLVASPQPLAFVPGPVQRERRADVRAFFRAVTPQVERERLLRKYDVSYVLIARTLTTDSTVAPVSVLRTLGTTSYEDGGYVLVRVVSLPVATPASVDGLAAGRASLRPVRNRTASYAEPR